MNGEGAVEEILFWNSISYYVFVPEFSCMLRAQFLLCDNLIVSC